MAAMDSQANCWLLMSFKLRGHRQKVFCRKHDVKFRPLSYEQIGEQLAHNRPFDKAETFAVQGHGDLIVEKISGSISNVVGLPLAKVRA